MNPICPTKRINFTSSQEVILLEASENYTIIHLIDGKKIISGYTLKYIADRLVQQPFIRINKSILLNIAYITHLIFTKEKSFVKLMDGREMLVSRRRVKQLQELNLHENTLNTS